MSNQPLELGATATFGVRRLALRRSAKDDALAAEWLKLARRATAKPVQQRGDRATRDRRREPAPAAAQRAFERALSVPCPTCGMAPGVPCVPASLTEPHLARLMRGAEQARAAYRHHHRHELRT
jgi:hypothetical protein